MKQSRAAVSLLTYFAIAAMAFSSPVRAEEGERLRVWQLSMRATLAERIARDFERRNPGVTVEMQTLSWDDGFQKLVLAFAAGDPPDVFELGSTWIPQFRRAGTLGPVTDVAADIGLEKLLLQEPALGAQGMDAIPWLLGTRALFVNRTLLTNAGIEGTPRSGTELLAACRAYSARNPSQPCIGLAAGDPYAAWQFFFSFAWGDDPHIFGSALDAADIRKGAVRSAAELYVALRPFVFADRPPVLDRKFAQNEIPFTISGPWLPLILREAAPGLDYEVAPVPAPSRAASHPFAGGEYLSISSTTNKRGLAARFIRFMMSPETLQVVTTEQPGLLGARTDAPAVRGLDGRRARARASLQSMLATAVAPPADPAWATSETALSAASEAILLDGADATTAIARLERSVAASLENPLVRSGARSLAAALLRLADAAALACAALLILNIRRGGASWQTTGLLLPWTAFFGTLCLLPAAYLVFVSTTSYDLLNGSAVYAGTANFTSIVTGPDFHRALLVTLLFTIGSVPVTLALALLCAYGIVRLGRAAASVEMLVYLPPVLPVVVTASIVALLFAGNGPIDQAIAALGATAPSPPWLLNERLALAVIVVHAVWTSFGYYALFFVSGLASIPSSVLESASIEGAGWMLRFRSIEWPALRGTMLVCAALQAVRSLQAFPEILVLTGGGPVGATTTVVYQLYDEAFRRFDFGRAAAIATLLLAAIALLTIPLLRQRTAAR